MQMEKLNNASENSAVSSFSAFGSNSKEEDVVFKTRGTDNVVLKQPKSKTVEKYFQPDGTTRPEFVTGLGTVGLTNEAMMIQGWNHLEVKDDITSRTKRVQQFEKLTDGVKLELTACSKIDGMMAQGDKLLSTLTFDEIKDFPGSTDRSHISGLVKVYLIQTEYKMKVIFSFTEGKYIFSAKENFFQLIDPTGTLSTMFMNYSMDAKFVSQESSLIINESFIDGMAYRKGSNGLTIKTEAATVKAGSCACSCLGMCMSCLSLNFICCTKQYEWNPRYCGCCKPKTVAKGPTSNKFMFWLDFSATDEFTIGKQTVEVKKEEEAEEEVIEFIECPIYCGGCCFVYSNPLKMGQALIEANPVVFCCLKKKPQDLSALAEGPKWDVVKRRHDEITMVLHYINPLDNESHACTLIAHPGEDEDIDAKYNGVRKFLTILAENRRVPTEAIKNQPVKVQSVNLSSFLQHEDKAGLASK